MEAPLVALRKPPAEPKPYEMGLQISYRLHPKGSQEVPVWTNPTRLGEVLRRLAEQKECRVLEGHLMPDHVHMLVSIPPKYAVSSVVGYIKGKSAIYLARTYGERQRNFAGMNFWARGYFVSTVGRDEKMIRDYIQNQEKEDARMDQMKLFR